MKKTLLLISLLVSFIAFAVTGCGKDSDDSREKKSTEKTSTEKTVSEPKKAEPVVTGSLKDKPEVEIPDSDPPTELVIKDIKKGKGKAAKDGDQVTVDYVGISWSDGQQFDASWDRGEAFPFELGAGSVIAGWDQGVKGMRVGGRRELVIPPELGYGPQGSPPAIGPNETLVFIVDLRKIK